jgi:hypothetical protein
MMEHAVFTVVTPVLEGAADDLDDLLAKIGVDPAGNDVLPLGTVAGLHFASLTIHRVATGTSELIMELNGDGSTGDVLGALVTAAPAGLEALGAHLRDWPAGGSAAVVRAWLGRRVVRAGAYHVGNTGRDLARIRAEAALWDALQDRLDAARAAGPLPPTAEGVRALLREHVAAHPTLAPLLEAPAVRLTATERLRRGARAAGLAALVVLALPLELAGVVVLRVKERHDAPDGLLTDPGAVAELADKVADLVATEDPLGSVQNHLTSVVELKPGPFRAVLVRLVLAALDALARTVFTKGRLGSLTSIHFAHWSLIDGGRRLLFVSNFDGSWESYLDDFIEKAHVGLTAVWSNGRGFPRTRWLVGEGASHGDEFKEWARRSQLPTPVWYRAYPAVGVTQIDRNSRVREGLTGSPAPEEVAAWLRLL